MTSGKVIERLAQFAPPVIAAYATERARCVMATAVGVDVLHAFGVDAAPYPVRVELRNGAFEAARRRGADPVTAIARGGHLLVTDDRPLDPASKFWAGHLMIHLPAQACLLDLDFQQFARPQYGIAAHEAECFAWPSGTNGREFAGPHGARIVIEATGDRGFEIGGDWADPSRRAPLVDAVTRAIRKNRIAVVVVR